MGKQIVVARCVNLLGICSSCEILWCSLQHCILWYSCRKNEPKARRHVRAPDRKATDECGQGVYGDDMNEIDPSDLDAAERRRLETLRDLDLLDTPGARFFDQMTALLAYLFDVPIAIISLVDENRLWFLSKQGVDEKAIPRAGSLCDRAIGSDGCFVVEDASSHPDFANNRLVTSAPFCRFYAAATLTISEKYRIGTLCMVDNRPRRFSARERTLLSHLGGLTTQFIEQESRLKFARGALEQAARKRRVASNAALS